YRLPTATRAHLKAGFAWRELSIKLRNYGNRRWSYVGATGLPVDADAATPYVNLHTGAAFPRWQVSDFVAGGSAGKYPADPSLWQEDLYFHEQSKYTGTRGGKENVSAGYIMAQGKLGQDGWLGRTSYLT